MCFNFENNKRLLIGNATELHKKVRESMDEFGGPSLYFHLKALEWRKNEKEYLSERHIEYIYAMLTSWGMHRMGTRNAQLTDFDIFKDSILKNEALFKKMKKSGMPPNETEYEKEINKLESAFLDLKVTNSQVPIVANSKTLAHILPDLIPPIDRQYTLRFFTQDNSNFLREYTKNNVVKFKYREVQDFPQRAREPEMSFRIFKQFCQEIFRIYEELKINKELKVVGDSFNSSKLKIIDNLIITFVKESRDQVSIIKNEQ